MDRGEIMMKMDQKREIEMEAHKEHEKGLRKEDSYFRALESAYNVIFKIDLQHRMVECVYGRETSDLGKLYDVQMSLDSAIRFWINNYIVEEDRASMGRYLADILQPGRVMAAGHPLQTEFRIIWDDQVTYAFIGVAIQLDPEAILFCCRDTAKVQYSGQQAREIRAMKKLHAFMERSYQEKYDAIASAIFEKDDGDNCTLLYASQSVLLFMGLRQDQYLHHMEEGFRLSEMMSLAQEKGIKNMHALMNGRELPYELPGGEKVTLSIRQTIPNVYEFTAAKKTPAPSASRIPQTGVFARTFGYFDIFVDGQPIIFSNYKEKELLALLIDRNGGTLTASDAIAALWENSPLDERSRARYRKLSMGLNRTLKSYGIGHILVSNRGVRSIDTRALTCDYYELLAGNTLYVQSFHNSYMSDYPWAEQTLATLWDFS